VTGHGLCGGGGYALNKAALTALQSGGWSQLLQEYQAYQRLGVPYGDVATSCVLSHRDIEVRQLYGGAAANSMMTLKSWQFWVEQKPLTYHEATPDVIRWLHGKLKGKSQEDVIALEAKAFENGCCCWRDEKSKGECQGGTLQENPVLSGLAFEEPEVRNPVLNWAASWDE